jgi:hypothetical protein
MSNGGNPNLVQLVTQGKWHALVLGGGKTACGSRIPMTSSQRHRDLIDSNDRCRDPKCITARLQQHIQP